MTIYVLVLAFSVQFSVNAATIRAYPNKATCEAAISKKTVDRVMEIFNMNDAKYVCLKVVIPVSVLGGAT